MNAKILTIAIVLMTVCNNYAQENQDGLGFNLAPDAQSLNVEGIFFTDDELADPPQGEIRKMYLKYMNEVKTRVNSGLDAAQVGINGQDSPWMPKFRTIITCIDTVIHSRLQSDVFVMLPKLLEIFDDNVDMPDDFGKQATELRGLVVCCVHAIAEHVIDAEGNVINENRLLFTQVFCENTFYSEHEWEDEMKPIDSAGIMILDAPAVTTYLKSIHWKNAKQFLFGINVEKAFSRYENDGNGMDILKTKYLANKTIIRAKWQEINDWVTQQEAASPPEQ